MESHSECSFLSHVSLHVTFVRFVLMVVCGCGSLGLAPGRIPCAGISRLLFRGSNEQCCCERRCPCLLGTSKCISVRHGIIMPRREGHLRGFGRLHVLAALTTLCVSFLFAAVTNYHNLSGFKPHTFIISQFLLVKSLCTARLSWVLCLGSCRLK